MSKQNEFEVPKLRMASEPWVMEQVMDTERRIERAFHDQTVYFTERFDRAMTNISQEMRESNEKLDNTIRWMVGLMITMIIAVVLAIFVQPHI